MNQRRFAHVQGTVSRTCTTYDGPSCSSDDPCHLKGSYSGLKETGTPIARCHLPHHRTLTIPSAATPFLRRRKETAEQGSRRFGPGQSL
jgi:hypothetical protein